MLETPFRIEPCGFEEAVPARLVGLAGQISEAVGELEAAVPAARRSEWASRTRVENAYFSNLIEGVVCGRFELDAALAVPNRKFLRGMGGPIAKHVLAQMLLEEMAAAGLAWHPCETAVILAVHKTLFDGEDEYCPGRLREVEVVVGSHQPPSAGRMKTFMTHFERRFQQLTRTTAKAILAIPGAHHRISFIHPFTDGNGRAARMMTHGQLLHAGIAAGGLWSVSRALARGLEGSLQEYLSMMERADAPRQGDRDGRGNLSLMMLESYSVWFLTACLEEIRAQQKKIGSKHQPADWDLSVRWQQTA